MILKFKALYGKMRIAAMAFVVAAAAVTGGVAIFNGNQANAAGQCVDYIYNRGGRANCITNIQTIINASGLAPRLTTDGIFGPATESSVKTFQSKKGITADGIVGKQTWIKLCGVTQTAAKSAQQASGCPAPVTPPPTTGWTKAAWGTGTNGTSKATIEIYACKIPVTATTFQVRTKTNVTASTGTPTVSTFLDVRKQDTAMSISTSANNDRAVNFTGSTGASYQLTTSANSYGTPGYAVATDVVWAEAGVIVGNSEAGAASTFNNFGSALSRPLKVSQLINC